MSIRIFLGLLLLSQLASAAGMEIARGKLNVSMIVLSSCDVYANSKMLSGVADTVAATVSCPTSYPFRASLAYGVMPGIVANGSNAGIIFSGARRIELSRQSGITENGVAVLTIAY